MKKIVQLVLISCFALMANAQVVYITPNGTGNGSSWANASNDLTAAMDAANSDTEIWVAQGTYTPTTCSSCNNTNRNTYFNLKNGLEVYGGFTGSETQRSQRDWESNMTILSGDIDGDGTLSNNSYTVVYTKNTSPSTIMDGFTITKGNASATSGGAANLNRSGAGFYNDASSNNISSPTVRNCIFTANNATRYGAAFFNDGRSGTANPSIENCRFIDNDCNEGAGLYNSSYNGLASPTLTDCVFEDNTALYGAGIYNNGHGGECSPTLINCVLNNNVASFYAGGMYNFVKSTSGICEPLMVNCIISNNTASSAGGIYSLSNDNASLNIDVVNCTFYGNNGTNTGGAFYMNVSSNSSGEANIANTIFWGSTAGFNKIVHFSGSGTPVLNISYSTVDASSCNTITASGGGDVNCGAGMNYNQNPLFVNAAGGDFHLTTNSPAKDDGNNTAINNTGITVDLDNMTRIVSSTVDMGVYEFTTGDSDGDGIADNVDNCPNIANAGQANNDGDPAGNVCDCDPNNNTVYPGAPEICDGLDNNCNNQIDETGNITFYADTDGDTYGDPNNTTAACTQPAGYVTNSDDCDDSNGNTYPGAPELCDGIDNNCNNQTDEGVSDNTPPTVNCQNVTITLTSSGTGSITPQDVYASGSDNCGSVNLISVNPSSFNTSNLGANTVTLLVNDGNGNSATCQATVTVNPFVGGPANYCNSIGNQPWIEWVENVTFATIDNDTGKDRYGDFTAQSTNVNQGGAYTIEVDPIFSWPHFNEYIRVWIDYNGDGDFTDANEVAFSAITPIGQSGTNPPPITGTIVIPANASPGATRMRVSMQRDAYADPCEAFTYGEVEDYTVVINASGPILSLICPTNVVVTAAPGSTSATASWSLPNVSTTCTGSPTLTQTGGPASGSSFPLGSTTITYQATDACSNVENCSFNVIVQQTATTLTVNCPGNITESLTGSNTSMPVFWDLPTTSTNCPTGSVTLNQTSGPASGSSFSAGVTTVAYSATDNCGNVENCSFTVTINPASTGEFPTYCAASGQQPWQQWISNVTFGAINNDSGKSQYTDYTALSTTVNAGSSNPISMQATFSWTQWDEYFSVWIDYNQDGVFDDATELAFQGISPGGIAPAAVPALTGNISIPASAVNGATGMRVIMSQGGYAPSCGSFMFGEVEDYAIVITGGNGFVGNSNSDYNFFSVMKNRGAAHLEWVSNTTYKTDYFVVERSADGENFEALLELMNEKNSSDALRFTTEDIDPIDGMNYYRILTINTDGTERYSRVRSIELSPLVNFTIFPNPAMEYADIDLKHFEGRAVDLFVYDQYGTLQFVQVVDEVLSPIERLDFSSLGNGMYVVTVRSGDLRQISKRVVVARSY